MIAAFMMLAAYHFLLPHLSHRFYKIGGQERANYLRAQQYLYNAPDRTNVILGSSMSLELNERILGSRYFKLTFPGNSILTSLEIVRRARKRPDVVLIETNELGKDADEELLHDLFSPWLSALRRSSPVFREGGRPANFLTGIAAACVSKGSLWSERILAGTKPRAASPPESERLQPLLFAKVLRLYHEQFETVPATAESSGRINRLAQYADALNREGSTCIFFEMPIDSSLAQLTGPATLRRLMQAHFPAAKYQWINFAHDHNYETKDGVHLTEAEASNVTQELVRQVNRIIR